MFRPLERDRQAGTAVAVEGRAERERRREAAMKTLGDVMTPGPLFTVQQDAAVTEAVWVMDTHNVGILTVLDGQRLVGVLSERDVVRRVVARRLDAARTRVADVMTSRVVVAEADDDCDVALRRMNAARVGHLLVGAEGRLFSMLSIRDLMRAAAEDQAQEIQELRDCLERGPYRRTPTTAI
jgi:CBS domain-containing protein